MRLADLSIRRPVFAVMLVGALIALGWISLGRLGVDLFPKVEFPNVSIATVLDGATPETIESEVTDVIEEEVNTIAGVEVLRSASSEGLSQVFIEFELEEDVDLKAQDVRDKVSTVMGELPVDVEPPVIEKVDPDSAPIMSVMISGDMPVRELTDFADNVLKERLQRISGVGSVRLIGDRDREVRIWLDSDRLRSYELTADDVLRALRREHAEIPGGRMDSDGRRVEFSVKTKGEVQAVAEFSDIVIAFHDGAPTYLRDVARVEDGAEEERTYAELNGRQGISLEIRRQSGKNTVEVARAVKQAVADIEKRLPPGAEIVIARDISRFIESSVRDVAEDMEVGILLVVIVILLFLLSMRATVIVAIAIPAAIISTFFAFYVFDFTINLLTLMALSVSIGLLVDDAIVVLESIHRHIEEGHPPFKAASLGVRQVGSAVLAGTASVMAVFIPIAFMEGIVGRFFFQYGLAIVFAVGVSLLVSLTLTPSLCARMLRKNLSQARIFVLADKGYQKLERAYGRLLDGAL
ncbi:MAG: efflux RND transporter permease subunit, partial [Sphingomonadales bacterium]